MQEGSNYIDRKRGVEVSKIEDKPTKCRKCNKQLETLEIKLIGESIIVFFCSIECLMEYEESSIVIRQ